MGKEKVFSKVEVDLKILSDKVTNIDLNITEIKKKLEQEYVSKDKLEITNLRVERIEKIVYGVVGTMLIAMILAIVKLVLIP